MDVALPALSRGGVEDPYDLLVRAASASPPEAPALRLPHASDPGPCSSGGRLRPRRHLHRPAGRLSRAEGCALLRS